MNIRTAHLANLQETLLPARNLYLNSDPAFQAQATKHREQYVLPKFTKPFSQGDHVVPRV